MKTLYAFLLLISIQISYSQIVYTVTTDKQAYLAYDTIEITVTAENQSPHDTLLTFGSSCQCSYSIDTNNYSHYTGCLTVLTSMHLDPFLPHSTTFLSPCTAGPMGTLSIGTHSIVGEVIGYGKSDAIYIEVLGVIAGTKSDIQPSESFLLRQNYPNPFNAETIISFHLPAAGWTRIIVYDVLGKSIIIAADREFNAGENQMTLTMDEYPSGIYFYRLETAGYTAMKKFILLK